MLVGRLLTSKALASSVIDLTTLGLPNATTYTDTPLPPVGACPHQPTLTIFVFDDSGSVSGGADPIGQRYEEARLAIAHLSRRCRCSQELVAVLHFDRDTGGDSEPTVITKRNMQRINAALVDPGGYGTSELGDALTDAEELALAHPGHTVTLGIFSDFELFDEDLSDIYERLQAFPGKVHAVVLGGHTPAMLNASELPTTTIGWNALSGDVARAVLAALRERSK